MNVCIKFHGNPIAAEIFQSGFRQSDIAITRAMATNKGVRL